MTAWTRWPSARPDTGWTRWWRDPSGERDPHPGPQFAPLEEKVFSWTRQTTGDDYRELHTTHSAWLVADEATRADRRRRWAEILTDTGHTRSFELSCTTEVMRTHLL